jgi:hypothetical protein
MIKIKFFGKQIFAFKNFFCNHYFSPLNTFMKKGKSGRPKKIRILRIRIRNTALTTNQVNTKCHRGFWEFHWFLAGQL